MFAFRSASITAMSVFAVAAAKYRPPIAEDRAQHRPLKLGFQAPEIRGEKLRRFAWKIACLSMKICEPGRNPITGVNVRPASAAASCF